MSLINISKLTFAYEGSWDNIFDNVSFQMDTNWKLGFTGRNGRGKTTFLKLLLGRYEYKGKISADVRFEYFPYEVPDKDLDAMEVIGRICPDAQRWEARRELSLLEVQEEALLRPFGSLSKGEQTKILLAALLLKENAFLLIDEPTNHLDMAARKLVGRYLAGKKGFILVSHDRAFLDNCVDHMLVINKANIEVQRGNFSSWWENKQRQDTFELDENEKLKKEIVRLKESARRAANRAEGFENMKIGFDPDKTEKSKNRRSYLGGKSKKVMQTSKNIEQRRERDMEGKSKLLKNIESAESLKLSPLAYHTERLVSLKDVSIFYGNKTACEGVSFTIEQGDHVAVCGKNGSGKSSILKLICGDEIDFSGDFQRSRGLVLSYVSQDTSFLRGDLSAFTKASRIDESLFKAVLRKLDFERAQFEKDMADFSEGQKKKVLIAKSLCERAHLYIWDEPLNYIDVLSRMQIEDLLLQYQPAILFVEHDHSFSENVATKTVSL